MAGELSARWPVELDQRLEQQLELAELDFAIEGVVGPVDDGDGERAVVAVPLEQV